MGICKNSNNLVLDAVDSLPVGESEGAFGGSGSSNDLQSAPITVVDVMKFVQAAANGLSVVPGSRSEVVPPLTFPPVIFLKNYENRGS